MMTESGSILVVGAGPTGLATTLRLRRAGRRVTVIDQSDEAAATSRAAVVHPRTLEVFESLGVVGDLLDRAIRVPYFDVRDGRRPLARMDFSTLPTRFPFTAMISQSETEQLLRSHLLTRDVRVLNGHRLVALDQQPGAVRVQIATAVTTYDAQFDAVVGADGMHSTTRGLVGIPFPGTAYAQSFVLADVGMDRPVPRDAVSLTFSRRGLVVVAPLPGGRFRVVATADDPPERPDASYLDALLTERAGIGDIGQLAWSGRFRVHHRLARRYRSGRVFLAGDAAHVHSPAGGQGMNIGIQDGVALADILGSNDDPDSYELARRPVAQDVLVLTDRMTRAATLGHPVARGLRNAALHIAGHIPAARRRAAMRIAELDDQSSPVLA